MFSGFQVLRNAVSSSQKSLPGSLKIASFLISWARSQASVQCLIQGRQTSVRIDVGIAAPALGQADRLGDLLRSLPALVYE